MMTDYHNQFDRSDNHFALWTLATLVVLAFLAYAANSAYYPSNILDTNTQVVTGTAVIGTIQ